MDPVGTGGLRKDSVSLRLREGLSDLRAQCCVTSAAYTIRRSGPAMRRAVTRLRRGSVHVELHNVQNGDAVLVDLLLTLVSVLAPDITAATLQLGPDMLFDANKGKCFTSSSIICCCCQRATQDSLCHPQLFLRKATSQLPMEHCMWMASLYVAQRGYGGIRQHQ